MSINLNAQFVADFLQLQKDLQSLRERFEQRGGEESAKRQPDSAQLQQLRESLRQEPERCTSSAAQLDSARAATAAADSPSTDAEGRQAPAARELEHLRRKLEQEFAKNDSLRRQLKQIRSADGSAKTTNASRISLTVGPESYAGLSGGPVSCELDIGEILEERPPRPRPLKAGSAALPNSPQELQRTVEAIEASRQQLANDKEHLENVVLKLRQEIQDLKHVKRRGR